MADLGFAAFLTLVCLGVGKRILDGFRRAPESPLDAVALALPLGMGLMALGTLALGELGWLNPLGLALLLAVLMELGALTALRLLRQWGARVGTARETGPLDRSLTGRLL